MKGSTLCLDLSNDVLFRPIHRIDIYIETTSSSPPTPSDTFTAQPNQILEGIMNDKFVCYLG